MKPKAITIEALREIQLRVLDNPLNKMERVRIPAMPEMRAQDIDMKAKEGERMPCYEFVPTQCQDRDGRVVWRHKFVGEVIL